MQHKLFMTLLRNCLNERVLRLLTGSVPLNLVHSAKISTVSHSSNGQFENLPTLSDVEVIAKRVRLRSDEDVIMSTLMLDETSATISVNHTLVDTLLHRFKNDWKSAFCIFSWAESHPYLEHLPESCDLMVDILGKARQFDKMRAVVGKMNERNLVSLKTVAKMMRRFAGAHQWKDAVRTFDELGTFGLEKNIESMNVLLDTLCKENRVEMARAIFLELKSHIPPTEDTFNIFIHGWCKIKRFEEAYWTFEEMKGHGFPPSVISYSTIIQFYCQQCKWYKVFELLEVMEAQGCRPSIATYTNIMCSLAKAEEIEDALKIADKVKSTGYKLDTVFYNGLIHTLGKASRIREAFDVFEIDMPKNGVTPYTSTYNTLIAMFCHHGQEHMAFTILEDMEKAAICKPDLQTFYPLLKACFKYGMTDSFLSKLLDDMVIKHHLSFDDSTYSALIHGLCRVDRCEWAFRLFEEMIGKELTPRFQTCRLLLDLVKQKNMYDAAETVEACIKHMKASTKEFPGSRASMASTEE